MTTGPAGGGGRPLDVLPRLPHEQVSHGRCGEVTQFRTDHPFGYPNCQRTLKAFTKCSDSGKRQPVTVQTNGTSVYPELPAWVLHVVNSSPPRPCLPAGGKERKAQRAQRVKVTTSSCSHITGPLACFYFSSLCVAQCHIKNTFAVELIF